MFKESLIIRAMGTQRALAQCLSIIILLMLSGPDALAGFNEHNILHNLASETQIVDR